MTSQAERLQAVERRKAHRLKMAKKRYDHAKDKIDKDYMSEKLRAYEGPPKPKRSKAKK